MSRRAFLAAAAATLVAAPLSMRAGLADGTSVAVTNTLLPDAELIAVCTEFVALEQQYKAVYDGLDAIADDDEAAAATAGGHARQELLLNRMAVLCATTPDGLYARAYALADHNREDEFSFDEPTTRTGRMLSYLLRDALAVESNAVVFQPPAVLLRRAMA